MPVNDYLRTIDGFLSPREASAIYEVGLLLPDESPLAVELGTWLGRSTYALAKALEVKKNPKIVCIDPFDGSAISASALQKRAKMLETPLYDQFIRNMQNGGVLPLIEVLRGFSYEFSGKFNREIDLLFIDADHEYVSVRRDFNEWTPKLKSGGYLLMDDVYLGKNPKHAGPRNVVIESVLQDKNWEIKKIVDALLIAQKQ